jgi:hypothetical protein
MKGIDTRLEQLETAMEKRYCVPRQPWDIVMGLYKYAETLDADERVLWEDIRRRRYKFGVHRIRECFETFEERHLDLLRRFNVFLNERIKVYGADPNDETMKASFLYWSELRKPGNDDLYRLIL